MVAVHSPRSQALEGSTSSRSAFLSEIGRPGQGRSNAVSRLRFPAWRATVTIPSMGNDEHGRSRPEQWRYGCCSLGDSLSSIQFRQAVNSAAPDKAAIWAGSHPAVSPKSDALNYHALTHPHHSRSPLKPPTLSHSHTLNLLSPPAAQHTPRPLPPPSQPQTPRSRPTWPLPSLFLPLHPTVKARSATQRAPRWRNRQSGSS